MKIDIENYDQDNFIRKERILNGVKYFLFTPKLMGTIWSKENLIFRSSVWDEYGNPVNCSFKKFFNFGEKPDVVADPVSLHQSTAVEKIDGSTLIISRYNKTTICRTRGTFDASEFPLNGHEIEVLKKKYNSFFDFLESEDESEYSYLFEWVSPLNRVVLDYGNEPDMYLTGVIDHAFYRYAYQDTLNEFAHTYSLKRPSIYTFKDLNELVKSVDDWQNQEGICLYYNREQDIKKFKSADYLKKHAFKSECSEDNLLDLFFLFHEPMFDKFKNEIENTYDFECMNMALPFISRISDANKELQKIFNHMQEFVEPLKSLTRKDAALKIQQAYGQTAKTGCAFSFLDNREPDEKSKKRILKQLLNK